MYLDTTPGRSKLDQRGQEGIFLGYSEESKAYRVWSVSKEKVVISRDVKFVEGNKMNSKDVTVKTAPKNTNSEQVRRYVDIECGADTFENVDGVVLDDVPIMGVPGGEEDVADVFDEEIHDVIEEPVLGREEEQNNESENIVKDVQTSSTSRGRGRPKMIRTGSRGRPRKQYQPSAPVLRDEDEGAEQSFLSEIPLKEAMSGPNANEWHQAIVAEMKSILKNDTWVLVDRPERGKIIGCRMVLRNKFRSDGTLERRKARLVAQGFSQQPGVHFSQTFAPVARFSSIRLMASLAARYGMKIRQFDIATAYLNGDLEEEILMETPKSFEKVLQSIVDSKDGAVSDKAKDMLHNFRKGNKVCLLKKSLYGLRQAGRSWYMKLDETIRRCGATPTKSDPCVFKIGSGEDITMIAIYVDDILIASRDMNKIVELKKKLAAKFEIKDLGYASYCLGVEFKQNDGQVVMHQPSYVNEVLQRFGMAECKPVVTPMEVGVKLMKKEEQSEEDRKLPYRELVGALTYLSTTTRPDIAFAASCLGQFNNCFGTDHWKAAKRVLRYLKGTANVGLVYGSDQKPIKGFVDADWGSCIEDRRSYTGYLFSLGGGPVSWDSRKQRTVALSTTEAEYMAMSECAKEAVYLQRFLRELGFDALAELVIFCDNRSALKLAENPTFHARSKHIDIRHHFVRDLLRDKCITIRHISTEEQVADFLTKGLSRTKHECCVKMSGLKVM